MLQAIPTITNARVPLCYIGVAPFGHFVEFMPNLTKLGLYAYGTYAHKPEDQEWNRLMALPIRLAFLGNQCIHTVNLNIPTHLYRHVLPGIMGLSALQSLGLCRESTLIARPMTVREPDAIYISMLIGQTPNLRLVLHHLNFSAEQVSETLLFSGLARAESLQSLKIVDCILGSKADVVANNLITLPVHELALERLRFVHDGDTASFVAALAKGLQSMPRLSTFRFAFNEGDRSADIELAQRYLLRKTCQLQSLEVLSLALLDFTDSFDKRLARHVKSSGVLRELHVSCPRKTASAPTMAAPALCRAIEASYTLTKVSFTALRPTCAREHPWDPKLERATAMVTRLNRSGRSYMLLDPANKVLGVNVLQQVKDDADCLYHHLRENPLLCFERSAHQGHASVQRKRRHGMSLRSSSRQSKIPRRDY